MGIQVFPASSGSAIKSIQRGYAASSGTITISAVDTGKTFVKSFSACSAGSVGITGTSSGTLNPSGGSVNTTDTSNAMGNGSYPNYIGTRTLSAGATNLTTKLFGISLTNSTTITATGACYWEVVEYA
jgi:hypothetical protein